MTAKQLGDEFKRFRKLRGLTQEALAHEAGISVSYLGTIERGKANPSYDHINKIAKHLNVNIIILFEDNEKGQENLT